MRIRGAERQKDHLHGVQRPREHRRLPAKRTASAASQIYETMEARLFGSRILQRQPEDPAGLLVGHHPVSGDCDTVRHGYDRDPEISEVDPEGSRWSQSFQSHVRWHPSSYNCTVR